MLVNLGWDQYIAWQGNLGQPFRKQFDNVHYTYPHPCTLAILTFDSVILLLMIYPKQIIWSKKEKKEPY